MKNMAKRKPKKKSLISKLVDALLITIIIILVFLIGKQVYHYFELKDGEKQQLELADQKFEDLTCSQGTVKSNVTPDSFANFNPEPLDVIGYIEVPSVNLKAPIIAPDPADDILASMDKGVAIDPSTAYPGQSRNTVISGHRELAFNALQNVQVGDAIIININNVVQTYEITGTENILPDEPEKVFYEKGFETLVLYTCYPFLFGTPVTERFVVHAKVVDSVTYEECS